MAEVKFDFTTSGQDEAARAFEDLKVQEAAAKDEAARLGAELRKLKESGELSQRSIEQLTREHVRAQQAVAQLTQKSNAAAQAMRQVAQAGGAAKAAQQQVAATTQAAAGEFSRQVQAVQGATAAFGALAPKAAEAATAITGTVTSAVQLGAAMGPLGVALGVINGVLPLLVQHFSSAADTGRELDVSLRAIDGSARGAAGGMDTLIARLREYDRAQSLRAGVGVARGDIQREISEVELRERAALGQLSRLQDRFREQEGVAARTALEFRQAMEDGFFAEGPTRELVQELIAAEEALSTARTELSELRMGAQLAGTGESGRSTQVFDAERPFSAEHRRRIQQERERERREQEQARRSGAQRAEQERREIEARMGREEQFYQWIEEQRWADLDDARRAREQNAADDARVAEEMRRERERIEEEERRKKDVIAEAERDKARLVRERELRDLEAQKEAARAQIEQVRNDSEQVLQPAIQGLVQATAEVIAGSKSADEAFQGLLASFLEFISQQAALSAAKEFAEAIAAFASYRYDQGAQHLAAGVAFTAVAVAAGAASIAVAPPASTPASPQANEDRGRGGGDIVINWNSPVITSSTHAELGREIGNTLAFADRRLGASS